MRFIRKLVVLAGTVLIALPMMPQRAAAQDLNAQQRQRLYFEVKPAVVLVWASASAEIHVAGPTESQGWGVIDPSGEQLILDLRAELSTYGSGFIVSPDGYIATNAHVIQLFHEPNEQQLQAELFFGALEASGFFAREAIIRGVGDGAPLTHDKKVQLATRLLPYARFRVDKDLQVYLQNWRNYPAEVKEYSPPINPFTGRVAVPGVTFATGKDVAILKIEGRDFPTMTIGDSERMAIGANVTAAGYPGVASFNDYLSPREPMQASFTRGQISSMKVDVKGTSLIQVDAAITGGNSGGPLLSDNGEVIGMATMGADVQGFNFGVPTGTITEFVRAAGVQPQSSLFDRYWREGLDHYFRGQAASAAGERRAAFQAAINSFDEVLRLMPDLPDAVSLRQQALREREQPSPIGDGGGTGVPLWIPVLVIAGLLLGAAGVWLRRRADGSTPTPSVKPISAQVQGGRLVVTSGPLAGNTFPVNSGLKIGRDPVSCQIVLSETTVSREHAALVRGADQVVTIRNLSGTNSTMVNDRPVQEAALRPGDRIRIGSNVLSYDPN